MASQPRSERSLSTLEEAAAEYVAHELYYASAEVQPKLGRVVIYVGNVPFALYVEYLA